MRKTRTQRMLPRAFWEVFFSAEFGERPIRRKHLSYATKHRPHSRRLVPVAPAPRAYAAAPAAPVLRAPASPAADSQKLRNEILRLELLVKKLQAELEAQKQYCNALEAHFKTLQETV